MEVFKNFAQKENVKDLVEENSTININDKEIFTIEEWKKESQKEEIGSITKNVPTKDK